MNQGVDPELIRKYLAGQLDNKAMHALEKQALDDPFLADALEGFAERKPDQRLHLADLSRRLDTRVKGESGEKGGAIFKLDMRWMAAAGVLLVVVAGLLWMWQYNARDQAMAYKEANVSDSSITDTLQYYNQEEPKAWTNNVTPEHTPAMTLSADTINTIINRKIRGVGKPLAGIVEKATSDTVALEVAPTPAAVAAAAPMLAEKYEKTDTIVTKILDLAAVTQAKEVADNAPAKARQVFAAAKPVMATRVIEGKVKDGSDGIPGSVVRVEGTNIGASTDVDGRFSLRIADTAKEVSLVATALGFNSKRLNITDKDKNLDIVLQPSSSNLNDVIVTNPSRKKMGGKYGDYYQAPLPAEGYDKYKQYLSKYTQYPASAAAGDVKGRVKVSFRVMPDGTLEDFKITRRLQPDCDAEALRVIKEGPAWTPASDGTATRVQIDVYFPAK
ncbi:TonB family protein [Chitinophaga rhizophila]|uniref:TonB family protein n=1 Tax=Chitinophaga rhizophila TaxID=2866212 RepID=A0ABS7GG44_9BACT|nr:TonB family protein [Chitinophaga rhizophila]MBW8686281.1 TonB family protein [Chitinophaga rhizophila]